MGEPDRGRIVWLKNVIDPQGKPTKNHRAIILTTNADHKTGKPIKAAVISSKMNYASEDRMVKLDHLSKPGGHPQTGLDRPSAVICHWIINVDEENIVSYGNLLYGSKLVEILEKVILASQP